MMESFESYRTYLYAIAYRMLGSAAVARFRLGTRRFLPEDARVELAAVNGQLAVIFRADERAYLVLAIEVEAQRMQTIRIVANPEKLAHVYRETHIHWSF